MQFIISFDLVVDSVANFRSIFYLFLIFQCIATFNPPNYFIYLFRFFPWHLAGVLRYKVDFQSMQLDDIENEFDLDDY